MTIIKELHIAVGLQWQLHESMKSAKRAVGNRKNIMFARRQIGAEVVQGLYECAAAKGLYAGALMLAAASSDALVLESLGDGNAWMCAVKDGVPLPGFDVVAPESEARSLLAEAMNYVPDAELYGNVSGTYASLASVITAVSRQDAAKAALVSPANPFVTIALVFGLLMLASGGIYSFYQYDKQQVLEREGLRLNLLEMQKNEAIERARIERQREIERIVAEAQRTLWYAVAPHMQMMVWLSVVKSIPLSVRGWIPTEIECTGNVCRAHWMRRSAMALPSSARYLPGRLESVNENEAISVVDSKPVPLTEWSHGVEKWPIADLPVTVASEQQVTANFSAANELVAVPGTQPPVVLAKAGTWRIAGRNHILLLAALEHMHLPGLTATTVKFGSIQNGLPGNIEIHGRYRIKQ